MPIDEVLGWLSQALAQLPALAGNIGSAFDWTFFRRLFGLLLLPPALPLIIVALGLSLRVRLPVAGKVLAWTGVAAAWMLSSNLVAWQLAAWAEGDQRGQTAESLRQALGRPDAPQAIVIIGGGTRGDARETPNAEFVRPLTLERLAHGAWVARVTRLPVLVSGGVPSEGRASEAVLMKGTLEESLGTKVRWVEDASRDTAGNARLSAEMLRAAGITRIVLVTQAQHMPRAQASFQRAGLSVLPAPHGFAGAPLDWGLLSLFPSGSGAELGHRASHELLGRLWYGIQGQ
jgi:uncharacterized SAM-binding protein YcdF (DUF218 family)